MSFVGPLAILAPSLPVPLLILSATSGGSWGLGALAYLTLMVFLVDQTTPPDLTQGRRSRLLGHALPVALGISHFPLLALGIWAVAGPDWSIWERGINFLAFGLFLGQVGTSNGHELIHRRGLWEHVLGTWIFISLLFGHHRSAHLSVHHVHVATPNDPNTARAGETAYHFLLRAWIGSFRAGLRAERRRLRRKGAHPAGLQNPYWVYVLGAGVLLALVWQMFGVAGVVAYVALSSYAQMQILLSDYVQHYGLTRRIQSNGKPEPVGPLHSWNAPHRMSGHLMLQAPRHSDHHMHPAKSFDELGPLTADGAPVLPYSLPTMAFFALVPPLWFAIMTPRLNRWNAIRREALILGLTA